MSRLGAHLRSRLAIFALFAAAGACTSAQRAPIERGLAAALSDEQLACLLKEHVPGSVPHSHALVVAVCQIGPDIEQGVLTLLQAADAWSGKDKPVDAGGP